MIQMPAENFIGRVVTSSDSVRFTSVDPYGHLNSSRYLEMIVDHRTDGVSEKAGLSTISMFRDHGIGFVYAKAQLDFVSPALLGDKLEIASWIASLGESGFSVEGMIIGTKNLRPKCRFKLDLRSVSAQNGRPVPLPPTVPCEDDRVNRLPLVSEYLERINAAKKS